MTPTDHHYVHSQLPHNKDGSSSPFNIIPHSHSSSNNPNSSCTNAMGGQTPAVFFATSSYIIGGHKPAGGQQLDHHSAMTLEAMINPRGPSQLTDFKDTIAGAGAEAASSRDQRVLKRPSQLSYGGAGEYDPGPGSTGSMRDPDMRMEYDQLEGGEYDVGGAGDLLKKGSRRLGYDQVKALEKAFEVENRLEPERKMRLASQLGLQPRQVAVWFQNRRARWKTKQMERDYSLLKNKFEALKSDRDKLLQERDSLQAELARFKGQSQVKETGKSKQVGGGEQGSPTLASGSLVDDAAPAGTAAPTMQLMAGAPHPLENNRTAEEEELLEEEPSSEMALHDEKLLQNDSLSSTEESDIQNDGAIEDSAAQATILPSSACKSSFHDEPVDYYAHHWRLPPAPTQLLYKPTTIKNEEWPENGENMNSFNMPIDTWYNW